MTGPDKLCDLEARLSLRPKGVGEPSIQASRVPLHLGPYLTHTQGRVCGAGGRGSGHQPESGDTGTGRGGGPGAAQGDQL